MVILTATLAQPGAQTRRPPGAPQGWVLTPTGRLLPWAMEATAQPHKVGVRAAGVHASTQTCGGGGAPRDSAGSGATEEGLTPQSSKPLGAGGGTE